MKKIEEKKIKIIAYSDYICPFCYIGYLRAERLKKQFDLEVEWRPFEIHPETPKEGVNIAFLPFPTGYMEMVMANVKRLAVEEGVVLKLSEKFPNSRLALYISEFARKKGKLDKFHKLILEKYWLEGEDIGNLEFLLSLAESVGLERDEILTYLESDEPKKILSEDLLKLRKFGINGVPTYFIGNEIIVGAQPYETFEVVINKIISQES